MHDSADIYTFLNHLVPSVSIEKSSVGKKKNHKNHGQDKIYIHQNMMSWSEDTEDQIH